MVVFTVLFVLMSGPAESNAASAAAAVAESLLRFRPMPPSERTAALPAPVRKALAEYREREGAFHSSLTPPREGGPDEVAIHAERVAIERTIVALFRRGDSARLAASYALDVDLDREAEFIDGLLRDLPAPWLAPYLHLISAHRKLCEGPSVTARRQLQYARDAGNPLIRVVAEQLLTATTVRWCSP